MLDIYFWYNDQNPESTSFSGTFQDDLRKCLGRFRLESNNQTNPDEIEKGFHIILLSATDENSEIFSDHIQKVSLQPNVLILSINPIESVKFELTKHRATIAFWDKLFTTGEIRFFRRDNPDTRLLYWEKVTDIAVKINSGQTFDSKSNRGCIYLSQDDINHSADRENLLRDLSDMGFDVLPDKPLSNDFAECTEQIKKDLEKSQLIIHLIPPIYTPFFINQHLSISEHQCNVSAEFIKSKLNSLRVIWISSTYEITDEENQVFVEKIQRDQDQTEGSIVLKSSIEDLKKYYRHILLKDTDIKKQSSDKADVYIIADSNSNGLIDSIKDNLNSKDLSIEISFTGITYNQHINKLASARMVVLCYTTDNEQWFTVKVNDILKSRGMDAFRPFEKLILIKGETVSTAESVHGFFTHVIKYPSELSKLSFDNQT